MIAFDVIPLTFALSDLRVKLLVTPVNPFDTSYTPLNSTSLNELSSLFVLIGFISLFIIINGSYFKL